MILTFNQKACNWIHHQIQATRIYITNELKNDDRNRNLGEQMLRVATKMKYKFHNNMLGQTCLNKRERTLIMSIATMRFRSLQKNPILGLIERTTIKHIMEVLENGEKKHGTTSNSVDSR